MNEADEIPGLAALRRDIEPAQNLWPAIELRLAPRRRAARAPWVGFALAASLLLAFALPLRTGAPVTPVEAPQATQASSNPAFIAVSAQLRVVQGAEVELLHALKLNPESPSLRRLLDSTRKRQHQLKRLMLQST